ncbi:hypothetical protein [Nonlabens xiamenensis]|uniref:hypothetical protein n=1 Tax=Nonlabens xiamenensis TaxID=2341043 RepID=UPI000F60A36F|nr:hypothetical protein [Nonlabens xiamenensis]
MVWTLIDHIKLALDGSLFVIVIIFQYGVYPGFKYFEREALIEWHSQYSVNMAYIGVPLMIAQIICSILLFSVHADALIYNLVNMILVLTTWAMLLTIVIPLHSEMETAQNLEAHIRKIKFYNFLRIIVYAMILLGNFIAGYTAWL